MSYRSRVPWPWRGEGDESSIDLTAVYTFSASRFLARNEGSTF